MRPLAHRIGRTLTALRWLARLRLTVPVVGDALVRQDRQEALSSPS
jgi:hypothetical protein